MSRRRDSDQSSPALTSAGGVARPLRATSMRHPRSYPANASSQRSTHRNPCDGALGACRGLAGPSRRVEAHRSQGAPQVPVLVDTGLAAEPVAVLFQLAGKVQAGKRTDLEVSPSSHRERGWIGDAGDAERNARQAPSGPKKDWLFMRSPGAGLGFVDPC